MMGSRGDENPFGSFLLQLERPPKGDYKEIAPGVYSFTQLEGGRKLTFNLLQEDGSIRSESTGSSSAATGSEEPMVRYSTEPRVETDDWMGRLSDAQLIDRMNVYASKVKAHMTPGPLVLKEISDTAGKDESILSNLMSEAARRIK